eukprot:ANDGO_06451.mRNA.1 hypothetical protein
MSSLDLLLDSDLLLLESECPSTPNPHISDPSFPSASAFYAAPPPSSAALSASLSAHMQVPQQHLGPYQASKSSMATGMMMMEEDEWLTFGPNASVVSSNESVAAHSSTDSSSSMSNSPCTSDHSHHSGSTSCTTVIEIDELQVPPPTCPPTRTSQVQGNVIISDFSRFPAIAQQAAGSSRKRSSGSQALPRSKKPKAPAVMRSEVSQGSDSDVENDVAISSNHGSENGGSVALDGKKQLRMMKNRESAAASRERKRLQMESLEAQVRELREENAVLRARNEQLERDVSMLKASGGSKGFLMVFVFSFVIMLPVMIGTGSSSGSTSGVVVSELVSTGSNAMDLYESGRLASSAGRKLLSLPQVADSPTMELVKFEPTMSAEFAKDFFSSSASVSTPSSSLILVDSPEQAAHVIHGDSQTVYFYIPQIQPVCPVSVDQIKARLARPDATVAFVVPKSAVVTTAVPMESLGSGLTMLKMSTAEWQGLATVLRNHVKQLTI